MEFNFKKYKISRTAAAAFTLTAVMLAVPAQAQSNPDEANPYKNSPGPKDYPKAQALILADDMTYTLNEDFSSETIEHNAIKILNKEGADTFKIMPREYNASTDEVELISARTITPDGKIINTTPDQTESIFRIDDSEANKDKKYFIIKFPNISEGAVIEYTYRLKTAPRADKAWYAASYLQNDIPILNSTYKVKVPKNVKANIFTNVPEFKNTKAAEEDGSSVYYWTTPSPYDTIPAAANKPNGQNYYKYIAVGSFADWEDMGKWAGEVWYANISDNGELNMLSSRITSVSKPAEEKINAVLKHMNSYFITTRDSDMWHKPNLAVLSKSQKLSPPDAAYLTGALLTKAGLSVTPYLTTNSDMDNLKNLPPIPLYTEQFLLKVSEPGGKSWWIDPSVPGTALDAPNAGWQGNAALEISKYPGEKAKAAALPLGKPETNLRFYNIAGNINPNGIGELTADITCTGLRANDLYAAIGQIKNLEAEKRSKTVEWIINKVDGMFAFHVIPYSHFFPYEVNPGEPVTFGTTVKINGCARLDKNSGYFATPLTVVNNRILASGLMTENRTYPIRFEAPFIDEVNYHVTLPEGSIPAAAPKNAAVKNEVGSYACKTVYKGRDVWFYSRVEIDKPWIYPEQFAQLKELAQAQLDSAKVPLFFTIEKKEEKAKTAQENKTDSQEKTEKSEKNEKYPIPSDIK